MRLRIYLLAAAAAALLAGCGHHQRHPGGPCNCGGEPPTSENPQVEFDPARDTAPIVRPNPLAFTRDQRNITITWHLPAGSKVRFDPKEGIKIDGEITRSLLGNTNNEPAARGKAAAVSSVEPDPKQNEIVECRVAAEGLEFKCLNRHTRPGIYKYTIKLTDGKQLYIRDPEIANW